MATRKRKTSPKASAELDRRLMAAAPHGDGER